ncbi:sensor histidine kinase [Hyphomonas sp. WL0036]|uniref:sensor histidine kinase n=1 Tax=Hyphomonas sediminis TaxID=2866160 RepID=UPI001C7FDBB4|nr:histidine kinase dimerization/phosphoacceptor domain -containing protein [Hyphomonas sediminis]MBY9068006.1 sensor histidine kinase [Hyphomonas sediminis]
MAIVLSPLLIMGAVYARSEYRFNDQVRYFELEQDGQSGLRDVEATLARTRTALRLIVTSDRQLSCNQLAPRLTPLDLPLRNVMRFDGEGSVTCSSTGDELIGMPMPQLEWNDRMRKGLESLEVSGERSMTLGDPAIYMMRRATDDNGEYAGSVGITLSLEEIISRLSAAKTAGVTVSFVVPGGQVIGSNIVAGVPMEWISEGAALDRRTYRLEPEQGPPLDVVLLPISTEGLWLMIGSPAPPQRMEVIFAFMVPILAYLAALLAVSWIADAMILRWLERIRIRIMDMRASSLYTPLAPELSRAPLEMQQVAEAFDDLTSRVSKHEADLQGALSQMKAAFREVHHRVKNNLQVMLSMLKLQGRGEPLVETQSALKVAAHRVAMMAAVHHTLLNEGDLDTVEAMDLFNAICNQVDEQQGWTEGGRHITPDVSPALLPADMAVPLGMFVLEAVGLLCPEAEEDDADVNLKFVRLEGGACYLSLTCGRGENEDDAEMNRDTNLFLSAFARQIGGTVSVDVSSAEVITIELTFHVEPVKDADREAEE